jgi:small subunit ribosomal protein S1
MAKADKKLEFKVIEFSKENKKIVVSHTRMWQAEEPAKKEEKKGGTDAAVKKINEGLERTTLGDLDVLASLKEEMEKHESK